MKIVVAAMALNEAYHIREFCENFSFADKIVISDGGSTDDTVKLAEQYPNVKVVHFTERIEFKDGSFMNPEGKHHNFVLSHAREYNPDWIMMQAPDHRFNYFLYKDIRQLLETAKKDGVRTRMYYTYLRKEYFTELGKGDNFVLAFRGYLPVYLDEHDPFNCTYFNLPKKDECLHLKRPYCMLHHTWPTPEIIKSKMERYAAWGRALPNPPEKEPVWGKLVPLEEWMQ